MVANGDCAMQRVDGAGRKEDLGRSWKVVVDGTAGGCRD